MSITNTSTVNSPADSGWLGSFARRQVFRHLEKIPRGCLLIEEGDEFFCFGDPEDSNGIKARIVIEDVSAYRDIAFGGSIGGAEAYMLGKWSTPNLVDVVRLMSMNIDFLNQMDDARPMLQRFADKLFHWLNRNTEKQARDNISRHYDLSNEFFSLFLDPQMMYSSAMFPHAEAGLDEAALYKLDVICRKLDLQPTDHLLEIGTGWGGLAIYAAKNYGCRVTTTTISHEQYQAACERVKQEGLDGKIKVLFEDYRNLEGSFDKLVSIEMIEAVGHEYYKQYFSGCASLLKEDGLMLLQAITIPDQRFEYAQKSVDFIQRYIFPGGSLPSHEAILSSVRKHTDLLMIGMQEIGEDYAKTLEVWRERFLAKMDQVRELGFDDYFIRMWNYYLCYCQGGFEERVIGTSQILLAKPDWRRSVAA
ncbi:MAG: class I SAM-dependent methyltransferase [Gammaproteobacteria bacterium]|nr:MAG: class I SAM-dependent methyltransferase [Gammaproteobacteria bacterium]UCH39770.1 MAG: class I SAM-dependent methyltransferase [Gammaproteobacteria bacterium]